MAAGKRLTEKELVNISQNLTQALLNIDNTLERRLCRIYSSCGLIIEFIGKAIGNASGFSENFTRETAAKRAYYFNIETLHLKQKKIKLSSEMLKINIKSYSMSADDSNIKSLRSQISSWTPRTTARSDPVAYLVQAHAFIDRLINSVSDSKDAYLHEISGNITDVIKSAETATSCGESKAADFDSMECREKRSMFTSRANLVQRWDVAQQLMSLSFKYESDGFVIALPGPPGADRAAAAAAADGAAWSTPTSSSATRQPPAHAPTPDALLITNEPGAGGTLDCETALGQAFNTGTYNLKYKRRREDED